MEDLLQHFTALGTRRGISSTPRYNLNAPKTYGGWRYATDAIVCVRVPDPASEGEQGPSDFPDAQAAFSEMDRGRCVTPLPPATEAQRVIHCPDCHEEICSECDGIGSHMCPACGQDVECESCDGTGRVSDTGARCPTCGGRREILVRGYQKIDGSWFDSRYIQRIREYLPNPLYYVTPKGMYFTADDGIQGVLMPVRHGAEKQEEAWAAVREFEAWEAAKREEMKGNE